MPRNTDVSASAVCPLNGTLKNTFPRLFRLVLAATFLLLLFVSHDSFITTVSAQSASATLSGVVTDEAGAVIPGVNVAVMNLTQGFERVAVSNGDGYFAVPLLSPDQYTIKAQHTGFSTYETRVTLNVNDRSFIRIQLKVGTLAGQHFDIVNARRLHPRHTSSWF